MLASSRTRSRYSRKVPRQLRDSRAARSSRISFSKMALSVSIARSFAGKASASPTHRGGRPPVMRTQTFCDSGALHKDYSIRGTAPRAMQRRYAETRKSGICEDVEWQREGRLGAENGVLYGPSRDLLP